MNSVGFNIHKFRGLKFTAIKESSLWLFKGLN